MSPDQEAIRKVFEEVYPENVRTKNLEGYGQMYTENALWMPPDAPDRCGISDIVEGFAGTVANQSIEPIFKAEEIEVTQTGTFGYVVGISDATIYPDNGEPRQAKYKALWLMKKEGEKWLIDRQIWNNKPL